MPPDVHAVLGGALAGLALFAWIRLRRSSFMPTDRQLIGLVLAGAVLAALAFGLLVASSG